MATLYYVGGGDGWVYPEWPDAIVPAWATASGGTPVPDLIPGSGDDVIIDTNSPGTIDYVLTSEGYAPKCRSMTVTAARTFVGYYDGSPDPNARIYAFGDVSISVNATGIGLAMFGTHTLDCGPATLQSLVFGSGASISLLSNLTASNVFLWSGSFVFNANGYDVTSPALQLGGGTVNLGSGTWTFTSPSSLSFSGGVLNAQTSTIKLAPTTGSHTANFGSRTLNNLWIAPTGSATITLNGGITVNDLKIDTGKTCTFTASMSTVVNSITSLGTATARCLLRSSSASNYTLTKSSGTLSANYLDIQRCNATGGAAFNAYGSVDSGNNSGWNFLALAAPSNFFAFF